MSRICMNCAKEGPLKQLIALRGERITKCVICGDDDVLAVRSQDPDLCRVFHGLVRYYFSEWQYNGHIGGTSLYEILKKDNPISAWRPSWNADAYENAIENIIWSESPFVLESGEYLRAIALAESAELSRIEADILGGADGQDQLVALLTPHIKSLSSIAVEGLVYYRARIGFEEEARAFDLERKTKHYRPYSGASLGAPPMGVASSGRLNQKGISVMYVASDEATAINEVRPHPGHIVSVAGWCATRDVKVANFNNVEMMPYLKDEKTLAAYGTLKAIDHLLSLPIVPEERAKYTVTQALADALKALGFEGAVYRSSVSEGANTAFFDPGVLEEVENSAHAVSIRTLAYDTNALTTIDREREVYAEL